VGAGYSGTPLAKKLGIREGDEVALVNAPDGFEALLEPLPSGVSLHRRLAGRPDVIVAFFTWRKDLDRRFPDLDRALPPDGAVWMAWPKRASKMPTDLTEDTMREVALPLGLVDNKVAAIDDTWSGLRLVVRVENRPSRR
jgi:hypothetical protein